jgi:hypothetical protein
MFSALRIFDKMPVLICLSRLQEIHQLSFAFLKCPLVVARSMLDLYVVVVASAAKFELKQLLLYPSNCCNSDLRQTGVPMLSQD